jgi:hypothetical protein
MSLVRKAMNGLWSQAQADLDPQSLLSAEEVAELGPLLEAILHQRGVIFERAVMLYVARLGNDRRLSRAGFLETFGIGLRQGLSALNEGRIEDYSERLRQLGTQLADRGVPFPEVIVALQAYLEAVMSGVSSLIKSAAMINLVSRHSHLQVALISHAYFRALFAWEDARVQTLEAEAARLPSELRWQFHGLVGASPVMHQLYSRIEAAGRMRSTILLVGESGSGKEPVAHAIHASGGAPESSFVALNCAAVPRDLIETEMFGYRRGAFSGAAGDFPGMFRAADGGTLFLDEVTEMGPETQSKLLRALQERTVRPIGSTQEVPVDIRLIASTNRDPEQAVREGGAARRPVLSAAGWRDQRSAATRTGKRSRFAGRTLRRVAQCS